MDSLKENLQCELEKLEEMRKDFQEEFNGCEDPEEGLLYTAGIKLCDSKIANICKKIEFLERAKK